MDIKLTLRLNDHVIKRAKLYAREHNISLSNMVESYLDAVTKRQQTEDKKIQSPLLLKV